VIDDLLCLLRGFGGEQCLRYGRECQEVPGGKDMGVDNVLNNQWSTR
jgi:hypothetical protein